MSAVWVRISLLGGIAVFALVVLMGLTAGHAPMPLLGRASGAGLFCSITIFSSISVVRSILQTCVLTENNDEKQQDDKSNT
jgi:uncharacterized membrane protein